MEFTIHVSHQRGAELGGWVGGWGHYALHGTGTICDYESGGILERLHLSKIMPRGTTTEAYMDTSKSMDAFGFEVMLQRLVRWLDNDVGELIRTYGLNITPKFDSVVLDGDSSTDRFVLMLRAQCAASAASQVCSGVKPRPCSNHLSKNIGKRVGEIGAKLHRTCSCPVRMTEGPNPRPYKTGERLHKGCPNLSHPLVKALQVGVGAALRGAAALAAETYGDQQSGVLLDHLQASLMSRFNKRVVG